ncbi:MAG: hypothetical protein VR68_04935 [Peptococcaceae bacterium BRH_c4a]|nr:MAG: hypothetical protein VR68_04935 [Peptococcaceae bacterium BRH_c4a]
MIELDVSRIKNIPGGKEHFLKDFEMRPIDTGIEEIFFNKPVALDLTILNNDGLLNLTGKLEGNVRLACSRCLEFFDMLVFAEMEEVYYNESQNNDLSADDGGEWISFKGDKLDITTEVVKSLLYALPMKLVCRQDCRGLCQNCGVNLNASCCHCPKEETDIRLQVLKQLLEEKE